MARAPTTWKTARAVTAVTGEPVPYSWVRVVMAETFVAMPFFVLAAEGAFRGLDARWSRTAEVLGASRWFTLRHVLVPMTLPGLLAGLTLAWARAFGEFGATITFVSNIPGQTQTLPSAIYSFLQVPGGEASAARLAIISVGVAMTALIGGVAGGVDGASADGARRLLNNQGVRPAG